LPVLGETPPGKPTGKYMNVRLFHFPSMRTLSCDADDGDTDVFTGTMCRRPQWCRFATASGSEYPSDIVSEGFAREHWQEVTVARDASGSVYKGTPERGISGIASGSGTASSPSLQSAAAVQPSTGVPLTALNALARYKSVNRPRGRLQPLQFDGNVDARGRSRQLSPFDGEWSGQSLPSLDAAGASGDGVCDFDDTASATGSDGDSSDRSNASDVSACSERQQGARRRRRRQYNGHLLSGGDKFASGGDTLAGTSIGGKLLSRITKVNRNLSRVGALSSGLQSVTQTHTGISEAGVDYASGFASVPDTESDGDWFPCCSRLTRPGTNATASGNGVTLDPIRMPGILLPLPAGSVGATVSASAYSSTPLSTSPQSDTGKSCESETLSDGTPLPSRVPLTASGKRLGPLLISPLAPSSTGSPVVQSLAKGGASGVTLYSLTPMPACGQHLTGTGTSIPRSNSSGTSITVR
jgi:hypothetical protein